MIEFVCVVQEGCIPENIREDLANGIVKSCNEVLGEDQGICGRFWKRIRAYAGGLGGGSGPTWEVLGADQDLSGWSWGRMRAYVGGLGRGSGRKVAQTQSGRAIQKGRAP